MLLYWIICRDIHIWINFYELSSLIKISFLKAFFFRWRDWWLFCGIYFRIIFVNGLGIIEWIVLLWVIFVNGLGIIGWFLFWVVDWVRAWVLDGGVWSKPRYWWKAAYASSGYAGEGETIHNGVWRNPKSRRVEGNCNYFLCMSSLIWPHKLEQIFKRIFMLIYLICIKASFTWYLYFYILKIIILIWSCISFLLMSIPAYFQQKLSLLFSFFFLWKPPSSPDIPVDWAQTVNILFAMPTFLFRFIQWRLKLYGINVEM